MTKKVTLLLGIFLLSGALLLVLTLPQGCFEGPLLAIRVVTMIDGFLPLALAMACLLIVLVVEWNAALNYYRLNSMSLAQVERKHPRLPGAVEVIMTALLSIAFIILFFQFASRVYAMVFTLSSSSSETLLARHLIAGDADNDGDLDYVALNYSTSAVDVNLYTNNGSGVFGATSVASLANVWDGCFADVDGDGDNDILLIDAASAGSERLRVLRNTAGSFASVSTVTVQANSRVLACGDIDNDGDFDAVMTGTPDMTQAVFLNNSHGVFTAGASTLTDGLELVLADFTSDGYLDIAVGRQGGLTFYRGSGTGAFVEMFGNGVDAIMGMAAGDMDNDGDIDLATIDDLNAAYVMKNDGTGTSFTSTAFTPDVVSMDDLILGDADNDGDVDVIVGGDEVSGDNGNQLMVNNGSATLTSGWQLGGTDDTTKSLVFLDFDDDGDLDYVRGNIAGTANNRYASDAAATTANTSPTAPSSGFGATVYSQNNKLTTIDSSGDTGFTSSVAIGADGFPVVSYYDLTNTVLRVTKCGNASCSSGNTTTTVDSSGDTGNPSAIIIGDDDLPVIAYYDFTNRDLKVAKCGNAACSSGNTLTTVDSDNIVGLYNSIALGADGLPIIAYHYGTDDDLRALKCGNAACSSGNTITTLDTTGDVGEYPSIAIGADDLPVISYYTDSSNDLKVVKCGNAACSSGNTITTVESTNSVGLYSSIAVPSDGLPVIAHHDSTNLDLRVTKCGNAACSSGNTSAAVDSTGNIGAGPMGIALASDGYPIISYSDNTNGRIKVTKCGNADCSSGNTTSNLDTTSATAGRNQSAIDVPSDGKPVIAYIDNTNASDNDLKLARCGNASCSVGGTDGVMTFRLVWGSGSDSQTSTKMLQYQVRLGTGSSAHNIVSGVTASPNWVGRVMPNGQSRTYLVKNLTCDKTYYWNVAAIDTGFKKTWGSTEQSFTLDSSCAVGSTSSAAANVGGGLPWNVLRQEKPEEEAPTTGTLTVTAFNDVNGDGIRQKNEAAGFGGLPVTASGTTVEGMTSILTFALPEAGSISLDLLPSSGSGYTVSFQTGSTVLEGYEPTTDTYTGGILITVGRRREVTFGFRSKQIVHYKPCLTIGAPEGKPPSSGQASELLTRLVDSFGVNIGHGVAFSGSLVSRGDFLTLLARLQCTPLIVSQSKMMTALSKVFEEKRTHAFIDVPLDLRTSDAVVAYSFLAAGIGVERQTPRGPAADFSSPVSRGEAVRILFDALAIPLSKQVLTGATLPLDIDPHDPLVPAFLTLDSLGLLPGSFSPVFGQNRGLTVEETSTLLVRGAFAGGKIALVDPVLDPGAKKPVKGAAPPETFLAAMPELALPSCLEKYPERAEAVSFSDVLPGDPLYPDLRELMKYGLTLPDEKTQWLVPGTERPVEHGIVKGRGKADIGEPVTLIETLRSLLILSCLPPPSASEVVTGKSALKQQETGERRIPRDQLSNLPRDESFASRVLYRAQDHEREFDLSLLGFTPGLLRQEERAPGSPLHLKDASDILASALLRIAVKQIIYTSQEAEGLAGPMAAAIRKDLLGEETDWRDEALLRQTPFTRAMLIRFLATVVLDRTSIPSVSISSVPIGQIWWERVQ